MSGIQKLFSPYKIGSLEIPNRIIRAAMWEPYCYNGKISEEFTQVNEDHIKGGCGMTTTGFVSVNPAGSIHENQLDLTITDVSELQNFTNRIHDLEGTASLNISYCGPVDELMNVVPGHGMNLSIEELEKVKESYVDAAKMAEESGFDAIEFHHHLITNYFYEEFNTRTDQYGGSLENRVRFPCEVLSAMREVVSDDFPIFAKLAVNPHLLCEPNQEDEYLHYAKALETAGASSIITFRVFEVEDATELIVLEESVKVQEILDIPVVYSGGVQDAESLETVMEHFEMVQIGRTLLRDYDFPNKVRDGEETELCIKCDGCHGIIWDEEIAWCF